MTLEHRTVLLPLDGLPLAEAALPLACLFADALGAELDLLRVVVAESPAATDDSARLYLNGIAASLILDGYSVSTRMLRGDPGECIVREATAEHVDLLVIGTQARTGLRRAVHGSLVEGVLHASDRPVLLFRVTAPAACAYASTASSVPLD